MRHALLFNHNIWCTLAHHNHIMGQPQYHVRQNVLEKAWGAKERVALTCYFCATAVLGSRLFTYFAVLTSIDFAPGLGDLKPKSGQGRDKQRP